MKQFFSYPLGFPAKFIRVGLFALPLLGVLAFSQTAQADMVTLQSKGTLGGQSVNATVVIQTLAGGIIDIQITNNLDASKDTIKGVIQSVSGVQFTAPPTTGGTLSGTARLIDIDKNTLVFSDVGTSADDTLTHWALSSSPNGITTLSGGAPNELVIGKADKNNAFPDANSSITGDNPSAYITAHFVIKGLIGVDEHTAITGGAILFGTNGDRGPGGNPPPEAPAPASLILFAIGGGCCFGVYRRRKPQAA